MRWLQHHDMNTQSEQLKKALRELSKSCSEAGKEFKRQQTEIQSCLQQSAQAIRAKTRAAPNPMAAAQKEIEQWKQDTAESFAKIGEGMAKVIQASQSLQSSVGAAAKKAVERWRKDSADPFAKISEGMAKVVQSSQAPKSSKRRKH